MLNVDAQIDLILEKTHNNATAFPTTLSATDEATKSSNRVSIARKNPRIV